MSVRITTPITLPLYPLYTLSARLRFIKRNTLDIVISAKRFRETLFDPTLALPAGDSTFRPYLAVDPSLIDVIYTPWTRSYLYSFFLSCPTHRITRIDFLKEINDSGMKVETGMND